MSNKKYYDTIILSMTCNHSDYINEQIACQNTWVKMLNNTKYIHFFYTSTHKETYRKDNIIYVKCNDNRNDTYDKTILAIKYIIDNYEFKHLIKTNCSTYINIKILDDVLEYKSLYDNDIIYCSQLQLCNWGYFARGDFNIIPIQYCNDLINSYNMIKKIFKTGPDDVWQSYALQLKYGKNIGYKYKTLNTTEQCDNYNYDAMKHSCQLRLKTKKHSDINSITNAMYSIHKNIISENKEFSFIPNFNSANVKNRYNNKYSTKFITYNQSLELYNEFSNTTQNMYKTKYQKILFSLINIDIKYCQHVFVYSSKQNINLAKKFWNNFDINSKHNCYTKSPDLYINYKNNEHHWTTTWCWNNIIPYLYKQIFNKEFDTSVYKLITQIIDSYDISYHLLLNSNKFTFIDYTINLTLTGDQQILRGTKENQYNDDITNYHTLFIGAHHTCKIINHSIDSSNKLLINCDSMAIPIIPIFANYFKEILIVDNRDNKSYQNIIKEFNATHYLCLMLSTSYYKLNKHITNLS